MLPSDPLTLGTFSHPGVDMTAEDVSELARPLEDGGAPRVGFAGEAMDPSNWSNVNGARKSGLREAERIIKSVRDNEG